MSLDPQTCLYSASKHDVKARNVVYSQQFQAQERERDTPVPDIFAPHAELIVGQIHHCWPPSCPDTRIHLLSY